MTISLLHMVKVFDSRRKQRWVEVDPLLTPPRSPTIPEPIIDDLLELWTGAGLDDLADDHDISINSALNELGFTDEGSLLTSCSIPFPPSDSVTDDDDELLERLFEFVDSPPPTNPPSPTEDLDLELESENSSCSGTTEKLYDEGFIGEDLINEQPDIFENAIRIAGPTSNIFSETDTDMKIKHDCMWAGQSLIDTRFDDFIDDFDHAIGIKVEKPEIKQELEDVEEEEMNWEESYCWSGSEDSSPSATEEEQEQEASSSASSQSSDEQLDWRERSDELEIIRNAAFNDHSYASPPGLETEGVIIKTENDMNSSTTTIQGIVLKEQEDWEPSHGPRKTKILVPLKELMETLHQKRFLVQPLGPGKKVIRLSGSDTVKGMLGVHASNQLSFSTASLAKHCVPQHLTTHRRKQKSKVKDPSSPSLPNQPTTPRPKKTKTHNNMERMRRIDLRNSFDSLKKLVPPLSKSSKCSKVEILRRAEEYIKALKSLEKRLVREEATMRSKNDALKVKLLHAQCA